MRYHLIGRTRGHPEMTHPAGKCAMISSQVGKMAINAAMHVVLRNK